MRIAAVLISVGLLCACGGKGSGRPAQVVLVKRTANGRHPSVTAATDAGPYSTFFARVIAKPSQRVSGSWVIGCRGFNSLSHDAGDVKGRTPLTVQMKTPEAESYRMAPGSGQGKCTVIAIGTLSRRGRVIVEILAAK